jgi:hypothetical protein
MSRSIAKEVSEHCSHMIGNGHLKVLQQLVSMRPCLLLTEETEVASQKAESKRGFQKTVKWIMALLVLLSLIFLGPPNPLVWVTCSD